MKSTHRSSRRSLTRAGLASALVALTVALPMAARADAAPVQLGASIKGSFTNNVNSITSFWDQELDADSDGTVTDRNNASVAGAWATAGTALVFAPNAAFSQTLAPYRVTWKARASGVLTQNTQTFRIDLSAPEAPSVGQPDDFGVVADDRTIAGFARDRLAADGSALNTSGIAAIELRFYRVKQPSPVSPPNPATLPSDPAALVGVLNGYVSATLATTTAESTGHRTTLSQCLTLCTVELDWSGQIPSGLPAGLWTVKAVAEDLAGNRSPESAGVTFVKAA